ncbi:L-malyl-CoA/beta-methylmalyl-CoA lyase [Natrarchaeobius sp. A-rgal3]|uniref:L-malyl-CoA/beta-methylmalyl-CoA lyase n=1 Tax=Natrarchaeobius versutus TaxID=1679078 RepID=UPI00350E9B4E
MTPTPEPRICRTFQTAPAAVPRAESAKYLVSGLESEGFEAPDWLVPDLEDGTAPDAKAEGLENVLEEVPQAEFAGEIWPRVEWSYADRTYRENGRHQIDRLVSELGDEIDGVVVPKVGRLEDVERAAAVVAEAETTHGYDEGEIELAVIVETGRARSDLREIARFGENSRLGALVFGPVDYTAELGGRDLGDGRPRWNGLLEALSNEASATDLLAIGGPFDDLFTERAGLTYYNAEGYADQVEHEARLGLDGSWSLYPKQTVQANTIHMPTPAELERDVDRIERFDEAKREGTGAVTIDGQMVDEATFKVFRNTIRTVRAIHRTRPEQTDDYYDDELLRRSLDLELRYDE